MTTATDTGAAFSNEFVVGYQLADPNPDPPNRPEGGQLDNPKFGDVGKPSENDPVLPSRQPIATPHLPPRKRK